MQEISDPKKTVLYETHVSAGGRMVEFAGYLMPVQYQGIVSEHLATRSNAGIFDVSHMGRFVISGSGSLDFLQYVLTNDAAALVTGMSQYTMIPNSTGGAIDDAYLYRFEDDRYLLVVNASNAQKDWDHLLKAAGDYDVQLDDVTQNVAMIALQGRQSQTILEGLITTGQPPENKRNACGVIELCGLPCQIARTGYTGEKICFELFLPADSAVKIWDQLVLSGASPAGLGARDTLRLQAGLPLYGHELGTDIDGNEIPIFACPLARFAVSFNESKGDFIGKTQLEKQIAGRLDKMIRKIEVTGKGLAREHTEIFFDGQKIGYVTSGNMIPVCKGDGHELKAMCLGYIPSELPAGSQVELLVRNKPINAIVK